MLKNKRIEIKNKQARFNYEWLEELTAGIQLMGTEIKSVRLGKASIVEGFCEFKNGELFLVNMQIDEYAMGNRWNHLPKRTRKLLLQKKELKKLEKKAQNVGLTIIPTKMFVNDRGFAKVNIALCKGLKSYDKRQILKTKDLQKDIRSIKNNY